MTTIMANLLCVDFDDYVTGDTNRDQDELELNTEQDKIYPSLSKHISMFNALKNAERLMLSDEEQTVRYIHFQCNCTP